MVRSLVCLFAFLGLAASQMISLVPGGTFECSNISSSLTPVENNVVAVQYLFDICAASPECAKLYGLTNGGTLQTFSAFLLQEPPHSLPLYLESPFLEVLCSFTLEDALANMWRRSLIVSGIDFNPCGQGEEFLPATRECRLELTNTPNSCADQNVINIVLLSVILAIVLVGVAASLYRTFGVRRT